MAHESMHEPYESLSPETRDMHRAIVSLMEELESFTFRVLEAAAAVRIANPA